jgi:hypothetical protein
MDMTLTFERIIPPRSITLPEWNVHGNERISYSPKWTIAILPRRVMIFKTNRKVFCSIAPSGGNHAYK